MTKNLRKENNLRIREMSGIGEHLHQAHPDMSLDPVLEWLGSHLRSVSYGQVLSDAPRSKPLKINHNTKCRVLLRKSYRKSGKESL